MSGPLHHYHQPFGSLSSNQLGGHRHALPPQHIQTSGLDTLAESSQYALQQLQSQSMNGHLLSSNGSPLKSRQQPFGHPANGAGHLHRRDSASDVRGGIKKSSSNLVRRRISRACDQCNQLRTKCDGKTPCAHCVGKLNPDQERDAQANTDPT